MASAAHLHGRWLRRSEGDAPAVEGEGFDVAILDHQMPDMDGLELAQAIRDDDHLSTIRLVLLTSSAGRGRADVHEKSLLWQGGYVRVR